MERPPSRLLAPEENRRRGREIHVSVKRGGRAVRRRSHTISRRGELPSLGSERRREELEVTGALTASGRVIALAGVEQVEAVQIRAERTDGVTGERAHRAYIGDAVGGCPPGDLCVERVCEGVRLRPLR